MPGVEPVREHGHQAGVKILAAELIVSAGGHDIKHPVAHFKEGDIKGASSKIINQDITFFFDMGETVA